MSPSIQIALRKLGLRPRLGPNGTDGGVFRYRLPDTGEQMEFRFDGAGIDEEGRVVVIEEESEQIVSLHIYGHLGRLLAMSALGEEIAGVVWIVSAEQVESLRGIVRMWYLLASKCLKVPVPRPYFLSKKGKLL